MAGMFFRAAIYTGTAVVDLAGQRDLRIKSQGMADRRADRAAVADGDDVATGMFCGQPVDHAGDPHHQFDVVIQGRGLSVQ